jgi:hypothetical protein
MKDYIGNLKMGKTRQNVECTLENLVIWYKGTLVWMTVRRRTRLFYSIYTLMDNIHFPFFI